MKGKEKVLTRTLKLPDILEENNTREVEMNTNKIQYKYNYTTVQYKYKKEANCKLT